MTDNDRTITLYFSRAASRIQTSKDGQRTTLARKGESSALQGTITDENGETTTVEYTAYCYGTPEETGSDYRWDDKKVTWTGPESQFTAIENPASLIDNDALRKITELYRFGR